MKTSKKRILAFVCAVCALAACLSLTACSSEAAPAEEDDSIAETDLLQAEAGGSITLPEGLSMPEENSAFVTQLSGDTLAGAFKNATSNYKTTGYFTTNGSITVTVSGELFTDGVDTQWKDATFSLWKQGDETTQVCQHRPLDGGRHHPDLHLHRSGAGGPLPGGLHLQRRVSVQAVGHVQHHGHRQRDGQRGFGSERGII